MFTKSYAFYVFEKKFRATIALLKTPQGRKNTQSGQFFFYVDRNNVYSRQPSFFSTSKKTHQDTEKKKLHKTLITDRTPCLQTLVLRRLPKLLHDYKRRITLPPTGFPWSWQQQQQQQQAAAPSPRPARERPRGPRAEPGSLCEAGSLW